MAQLTNLRKPYIKKRYFSFHDASLAPIDSYDSKKDTFHVSHPESFPSFSSPVSSGQGSEESRSNFTAFLSSLPSPIESVNTKHNLIPKPNLPAVSSERNQKIKSKLEQANTSNISHLKRFSQPLIFKAPIADSSIPHHSVHRPKVIYSFEQSSTKIPCSSICPVSDPELPLLINYCSFLYVSDATFDCSSLPPLPEINDASFNQIFEEKIQICSKIFDFTDPTIQNSEKTAKGTILCEFLDFLKDKSLQLTPTHQTSLFRIFSANIFQRETSFPPLLLQSIILCSSLIIAQNEIGYFPIIPKIMISELSLSHLICCYQMFDHFIQAFPDSPELSEELIKKLVKLTQLPDLTERLQIVSILKTIYNSIAKFQPLIFKIIQNTLYELTFESSYSLTTNQTSPFCQIPLLILLNHIYNRAISEGSSSLVAGKIIDVILSLLGYPYISYAFYSLTQIITTVFSSNHHYFEKILRGIEKKWPKTDSMKQVLLINLLLDLIIKSSSKKIEPFAFRLFQFFDFQARSSNVLIISTALDFWVKCKDFDWFLRNSRLGISTMFESVWSISENQSNKVLQEKAKNVLSIMSSLHKNQFQQLRSAMKAKHYPKKTNIKELSNRFQTWASIAKLASMNNDSVDYASNKERLIQIYNTEKSKMLDVTRFMSGPPYKKE